MLNNKGYTLLELMFVLIILLGYIINIVVIASNPFILTGLLILRIIGIFVPLLGAILGFIPS